MNKFDPGMKLTSCGKMIQAYSYEITTTKSHVHKCKMLPNKTHPNSIYYING
jgi:hypothetical protein